jgi:hypothetical protein
MPIRVDTPPKESLEEVRRGLPGVAALGREGPRFLREAALQEHKPILPHKVFTIGLEDLAQGRGLENARLVGWRYLIERGSRVRAAVEVACDSSGGSHEFAGVNEGPFNQATQQALDSAQGSQTTESSTYEFNVLRIPAIHVLTLWLRDEVDGKDLLIPINPAPPWLISGKTYGKEELETVLRNAAEQRLKHSDLPGETTAS